MRRGARAPRRAAPGRRTRAAGGRRSSAAPAGGRCSRSRARRASRARDARAPPPASTSASCSSRTPVRAVSRSADAERLPARASCAQPAGGRAADAPLELRLARVERVAERRVPGKLVAGDRVQLEQAAQERLRVLAREVAALDERDRVREIGEREPAREPRPVRALGRVRGATSSPAAPPRRRPPRPSSSVSATAPD